MRHYSQILLLFLSCCTLTARAQDFKPEILQQAIRQSIQKAYPASVRIWGFDTVRNARTGAQFTGVVVTPEGHILTAAHVNAPGNTYKIMFPDGRNAIAVGRGEIELEATPSMPDVAMMKIVGGGTWPFAAMGHSAALAKDMLAISIAYPETLDQPLPMVRMGAIYDVHNQYGFLQSTCLMEPGDSGGPMFDALGRVTGIHSAVDINEKENFEVPVDLYRTYWSALNHAKTYAAYPTVKDEVPNDLEGSKLLPIAELDNLDKAIKVVPAMMKSTFVIKSTMLGKPQQIVAALVSVKGFTNLAFSPKLSFIVSKASYVGDHPQVLVSGKLMPARVIARDKENDLVLLGIEKKINGGIELAGVDTSAITLNRLGELLISPLEADHHRISVLGTKLFSLPKLESVGYLGAQVAYFGPLVLTDVAEQGVSGTQTLAKGDELIGMNGIKLGNRADYLRESKKYWPGDSIRVELTRSGKPYTKDLLLGFKPQLAGNHQAELFEGGKSRRRDGYTAVFAHDARLKPEECGGAVYDLHGRFYGLNIGRYSRVSNVVVPASAVIRFVEQALRR